MIQHSVLLLRHDCRKDLGQHQPKLLKMCETSLMMPPPLLELVELDDEFLPGLGAGAGAAGGPR